MDEFLNQKMKNCEILAIPEYDGYYVSVDGDVYSDKYGSLRKLKPFLHARRKYYAVDLRRNRKTKKTGKKELIHRLVAETFLHNTDPTNQVDHINRNKLDNRLCNLRWVSHTENMKNYPKPITNKSGFTGVHFHIRDNYWVAIWRNNNRQCSKSFSVEKYGDEEAKKLAIEHREKMEKLYYPTLTKI